MNEKIRVGILFGGQSVEHEVSIKSAKNILASLDLNKFDPILIGIDKNGQWYLTPLLTSDSSQNKLTPIAGSQTGQLINLHRNENIQLDVIFPVLHGTNGEDGTIQGLLKLSGIPFVGAGILGSAIGMDKDVAKRLLRDAGVTVADFVVSYSEKDYAYPSLVKKLGTPFFLKPANSGSSVGVHKIKNEAEYLNGLKDAFAYDTKIIIEEYIKGREIECSVLGNENPQASVLGEVVPHHEFYSYEAKYLDENGAELIIPAELPVNISNKIREIAIKAFKVLCCEGMARVDFFVTKKGKIYVNEINTIPGFTNISMYPKLWEASGISQTELMTRLIELALERDKKQKNLVTTYSNHNLPLA